MKKRAKQVDKMVESMNNYLRVNRIISSTDTACLLMTGMLLNADAYNGFNWFYCTKDGIKSLVGSGDEEVIKSKDGYIQFY